MKNLFTIIFISTILICCDSSTKFTDGKFYGELENCQKEALNLYRQFEKVSIEKYRNDDKPFLEKSCQVFDLFDLLNQASRKKLSVILYFNAFGCQNCRVMEKRILNNSEIYKRLKSDFLFIPLTVDDRTILSEDKFILPTEDCDYYGSNGKMKRIASC